jgi:hypothetical protein
MCIVLRPSLNKSLNSLHGAVAPLATSGAGIYAKSDDPLAGAVERRIFRRGSCGVAGSRPSPLNVLLLKYRFRDELWIAFVHENELLNSTPPPRFVMPGCDTP